MKKNSSNLYAFAIQDQLSNGLTGQTPTIHISKDGGSFAAATNSATEFNASTAPGLYTITFTATECDCDVMIIQVYLPNGQDPAILDVVEMQSASGGATPQQIWEYAGGRTVTNTIPTAQNIWEYSSRTLTASALTAQQVWEYSGGRTLTASPTDISGLATSSALSAVATNVFAVKAKTDNLPSSPAAVGSEMALTSAAISAVQNELATSSELSALESHGDSNWSTATGFATPSDLSGLSTFNASTDKVTLNTTEDGTLTAIKTKVDTLTNTDLTGIATSTDISNAQTAIISRGNEAWLTATGFTVPSDLSNLATAGDISGLASYGDTKWLTATGFATPSDIPSASDNASAVWSATSRTLTESALTAADVWSYSTRTLTASALTAQEVWEYSTRELTSSPTDISGLATSQDISDLQTHGDASWATATGFATPADIPTDYAKPGDTMTLTSSTLASVITGVWNYDNRTLTQEIVSQVTAEDIASISIAVWSYVPRKLTSIVSDVIEPNK